MGSKYENILISALTGNHYFTNEDIRMNKKYGFKLTNSELNEYLNFKEDYSYVNKYDLPLKSFNSKKIFYYHSSELLNSIIDYNSYFINDIENKSSTIVSENYDEMILSRIASELEGSLKIEGVNTTRKKILEIMESKNAKDSNEQIIFNMSQAYNFISSKPDFNKENLLKLYNLLSDKSLNKEDELRGYYREEMVEVGGHDGCNVDQIEECMKSLFDFINDNLNGNKKYPDIILPFIAHYYILYIHPYMDFNGRTARMVSLWISILMDKDDILPTYISEAINDDKNNYYKAIDNTRNSHNDLTYFLTYLCQLANQYYLVYKNVAAIKEELALIGESITNTEAHYLKKIIVNKKKGWFNYKGFIEFCNLNITKQGSLKILNNFLKLNILKFKLNSKRKKIFILNEDMIKYELN
ncbi:MAG: Fic family protein [Anaeroplasma bactoclasticum]|nr:Fic family protein [Anaeroplasma bactoclasticum]